MKNCFRSLIVFAIIGFAINLVVCATVAIRSNMSLSSHGWRTTLALGRTAASPGEAWLFWRLDKPGLTAVSFTPPAYSKLDSRRYDAKGYEFRPDLIPAFSRIEDYPRPSPVPIHGLFTEAVGWPLRSFATSEIQSKAVINVENGLVIHSGDVSRLIPLRPLWLGLIGNTVAIGGSLWTVLTAMAFISYRRQSGRTIPDTYSFADARRGHEIDQFDLPERKRAA